MHQSVICFINVINVYSGLGAKAADFLVGLSWLGCRILGQGSRFLWNTTSPTTTLSQCLPTRQ